MGGGAVGGLSMAHPANAMGRVAQPQQQHHNTTGATAPPPSAAALGADLIDKNQGLSLKNVRNLSHLPIVAVDLHAHQNHQYVAYFPPKSADPSKGDLRSTPVPPPRSTTLQFAATETAHKTLKKYLNKNKSFDVLQAESLAVSAQSSVASNSHSHSHKKKNKDAPPASPAAIANISLQQPHLLLGLRRIEDAPAFVQKRFTVEADSTSPAFAEESHTSLGVTVSHCSVDGVSPPQNDDDDRVAFKVRLHASKKAITVFPEEAVEIVLHQARQAVAQKAKLPTSSEEEMVDCPCAIAVPTWAMHDAAVEALSEAAGLGAVIVPRNVAALAGELVPTLDGRVTPLLERTLAVRASLYKEYQQREAMGQSQSNVFEDAMTVVVFSTTSEGVEGTVVQVSDQKLNSLSCVFGEMKVVANVSYLDADPLSCLQKCATELEQAVGRIAPEMDGPTGIALVGDQQKELLAQWIRVKNEEWKDVPVFPTDLDCVAKGAATLGAVSHGRILALAKSGGGSKPRAELGLRVQNVAPCAVAIRYNYNGTMSSGKNTANSNVANQWSEAKVLFDFDRPLPAGPHVIECKAAECVVHRATATAASPLDEQEFIKQTKNYEGAKGIPLREAAALNLQVQVLQKWTRNGEWKPVGDILEPLVQVDEDSKGKVTRVACESVTLEISLGVTGLITRALVGERYVC